MAESSRNRAVRNYRSRLADDGIARFEVIAPQKDKALIRTLAKRLADGGPDADATRRNLRETVATGKPSTGGILASLRASPLVGANLDIARPQGEERSVDL